ncbi:MAG: hypothetical protein EOO39_49010, partial [Cytophagaceae bacterium]
MQEQTVDLTNVLDNNPDLGNIGANDERHPYWTEDEQTIYYSSNTPFFITDSSGNRVQVTSYQLWRIPSNGSGTSSITGVDTGAQPITADGNVYDFPAVNSSNRIAYLKSLDGGTTFHLYETTVPAAGVRITPQVTAESLT